MKTTIVEKDSLGRYFHNKELFPEDFTGRWKTIKGGKTIQLHVELCTKSGLFRRRKTRWVPYQRIEIFEYPETIVTINICGKK